MIKLKQQVSFIEENPNNNIQSLIDKKLLEVNNVTENQKFVINNINEFHNQLHNFNDSKKESAIKDNLIIYCISYFITLIGAFTFHNNSMVLLTLISYNIYTTFRFMYNNFFMKFGHENNIEIPNNFFDNKFEPISPAQIYYIQNKEISENDLNKPNFWKPMNTEELFNWIEKNNL